MKHSCIGHNKPVSDYALGEVRIYLNDCRDRGCAPQPRLLHRQARKPLRYVRKKSRIGNHARYAG
ncbi:MAG: hypothetical protein ACLUKN_14175 [Bacilli bacterium]